MPWARTSGVVERPLTGKSRSLLVGEAFAVVLGVRFTRGSGDDAGVALVCLRGCFDEGAGAMATGDLGLRPGLAHIRLAL